LYGKKSISIGSASAVAVGEIHVVKDIESKKPDFDFPGTIFSDPNKQKRHQIRACVDRRSDNDRRREYDLDYFTQGGSERRKKNDRRKQYERRTGWKRVRAWCSVLVGLD